MRTRTTQLTISSLLLIACATSVEPPTTPNTTPPLTPALAVARAEALECAAPAPADPKLSRDSKYGCFCGVSHPNLKHSSGRQPGHLSDTERLELIESYYRIKPIDDIDAACQAHDVCWVMSGKPSLACNDQFDKSLAFTRQSLERYGTRSEVMEKNDRCWFLAHNLGAASFFVMEATSDDPVELSRALGRIALIPLTGIYAALHVIYRSTFDYYPHPTERCRAERKTSLHGAP